MQTQAIHVYNINIEEYFANLLKHYGVPENEISLPKLKNMSGQLLQHLGEAYQKMSEKAHKLYPLVARRSKGGIVFELQGVKEGRIPFHGAQDKALYLFFRKHGVENLSSQEFLWAKEEDKRIRQSLLGIYRATRGNKQDAEYLALIDKINDASLSQSISRINSAFKEKVSATVLGHYTISTGSNEPRKVLLPDEYFILEDPKLEKAMKDGRGV